MTTRTDNRRTGGSRRPAGRPVASTRRWPPLAIAGLVVGAAVVVLLVIFTMANANKSRGNSAGSYRYQVGNPGPGAAAPPVQLESTTGERFDLAAQRGQTVLLYFQEGLGCQPCWDQMRDIQTNFSVYTALGIDKVVSITTNPIDKLRQKVAQDGITIPVLSDPDLTVSRAYAANKYGMMGDSSDGHSFILVGADGTIRWRADYGGSPDYTMYVPSAALVADLHAGGIGPQG